MYIFVNAVKNSDVRCQRQSFIEWRWSKDCRLKSIAHTCSVYDIVLCVYEHFRVDRWKGYVNDDRLRVDKDVKYAFTCVCVYNRLRVYGAQIWCLESKKNGNKLEYSPDLGSKFSITMGSRYLIIREIQSKCLAIKWESNLTHWLLYLIMTKFCQALFHFLPYNKSS